MVPRLFSWLVLAAVLRAQEAAPVPPAAVPTEPAPAAEPEVPAVASVLEVQVELHRRGFSCGSIDGVMGLQTAAALKAFQRASDLPETGQLDADTRGHLRLTAPALTAHIFMAEELAELHPVPVTWLEKSQQAALGYATPLEFVAERYRASPALVRRLNPQVNWDAVAAGTLINVPAVERVVFKDKAAQIKIRLEAHELEVLDADDRVIVFFPVSIAKKVEKRPVGELHVRVVIPDPNYTFDPEVYPESEEAKTLGRKLVVPPGPNNPVGRAWIGLDLPGYGIHGTPDPEKVGRTESHGCFRLANWDAVTLLGIVPVGVPVLIEP